MFESLKLQRFDTDIFRVPFYRVATFDEKMLEADMEELKNMHPLIVDVKFDSYRREWDHFFQMHGFRKVCMQVELECAVSAQDKSAGANIETVVSFPEDVIDQHAENIFFDRFSLDFFISQQTKNSFYQAWINNSLKNPEIKVASIGNNFCTFKEKSDFLDIDLFSVLDKRQKIGTKILKTLNSFACQSNKKFVRVLTECENMPAYECYVRCGYVPKRFISCFHLVKAE